jgi:photosystem II stability/assembly factor-like uncharacterized protein
VTSGIGKNESIKSFAISGSNMFAGTGSGVYLSTNSGANWTQVNNGLTNISVDNLAAGGTNIYAKIGKKVFISHNNGTNWTEVFNGSMFTYLTALEASGTNVFVLTDNGIFLSRDNGSSWAKVNTDFTKYPFLTISVNGTDLYAGTYGGGVWRVSIPEIITSLKEYPEKELSEIFSLEQNYPNPFNPRTNIRFSIPRETHVLICIYNSMGKEVTKLISQQMHAGIYTAEWNADGYASGIYFCRIIAGNYTETKKLLLLK